MRCMYASFYNKCYRDYQLIIVLVSFEIFSSSFSSSCIYDISFALCILKYMQYLYENYCQLAEQELVNMLTKTNDVHKT